MDRLDMRMAVFAFSVAHIYRADFEIIVHIFESPRRHLFEQSFHIGNKQRLGFVDDNRHRGMQTLDINHSVFDAGLLDFLLNLVGDIDKIQSGGGFHLDNMVDNFHKLFTNYPVMAELRQRRWRINTCLPTDKHTNNLF